VNVLEVVGQVISVPAVQGMLAALGTEVLKKAPVGPAGGPGLRLFAAVLALASVLASAAAKGQLHELDPELVGRTALETLSAFLAAVGAWQVVSKRA